MKITEIKEQRRQGRLSIFLDGEFWLGLSVEGTAELGLREGLEISEAEKEQMETESLRLGWYDRALRFLGARRRSRWEMERKLKGLGAGPAEVAGVVERLERVGLLDDLEFAKAFIRDRDAVRPMGAKRLQIELRAKGVGLEAAEEALREREGDEEGQVSELLEGRFRLEFERRDEPAVRQKLESKLMRRGFDPGLIRRLLR